MSRERKCSDRRDTLAEHVKRVVDAAPPLTAEQRSRLGALLAPPAARAGDAA